MDTLVSLKVFAAVAEAKSFVAAADRLGLSAAMTSKHVQHIEARVGARLLNRTSRSVSLTEAGAVYLESVRTLMEGLDEAEARLAHSTLDPRGTLKISLPVWFATSSFTRMLALYRDRYPNVLFDIDLSGRQVNLVEDAFDLALRVSPSLDEGLIAKRLVDIAFHIVAAPALLDRIGRPGTVDDLNGLPFLAYTPVSMDGRVRLGLGPNAPEVRMTPVIQSANETLLFQAALEGVGIAIMPHPVAQPHLQDGKLERLLPDLPVPTVTLSAIYPNRSYLAAKTRSFLDFLAGPDGLNRDACFVGPIPAHDRQIASRASGAMNAMDSKEHRATIRHEETRAEYPHPVSSPPPISQRPQAARLRSSSGDISIDNGDEFRCLVRPRSTFAPRGSPDLKEQSG